MPAFCVLIFYAMHRFLVSKTTFDSCHGTLCSCICFVTDNIVAFLWVICHFSLALIQILLSSLVFSHSWHISWYVQIYSAKPGLILNIYIQSANSCFSYMLKIFIIYFSFSIFDTLPCSTVFCLGQSWL